MTNACRPRCTSLARPWRAAIVDRTQETYAPRSPGGTAVRGPRSAAAARRKLRRAPISADTRPSAPASIPSTAAPGVRKRGCGSITERTFGAPCWRTSILKTLLFAPAGFAQVAGLRRLISKAFRISTSGHTRGRAARRRPRATGPHTAHSSPTQPGRQRPHTIELVSACLVDERRPCCARRAPRSRKCGKNAKRGTTGERAGIGNQTGTPGVAPVLRLYYRGERCQGG